jgi:hypothetical protein
MTIEVTQEDIDNGKRRRCRHCPVALALRRFTRSVWVADQSYLHNLDLQKEIGTPNRVSFFIEEFDAGKPVKPFTFKIDL